MEQCPQENFLLDLVDETADFNEIRKKLICDVDTSTIATLADAKRLAANNQCAQWYLKSEPSEYRLGFYCKSSVHGFDNIIAHNMGLWGSFANQLIILIVGFIQGG